MNLIKLAASIALATGLSVGAFSDAAVARSRTPTDGSRMDDLLEFDFFLVDETPEENPIPKSCKDNTCLFEGAIEDFVSFFDGGREPKLRANTKLSGIKSVFNLKTIKGDSQVQYFFESSNRTSLYDEILKGVPDSLKAEYEKEIGDNSPEPFIRFFWNQPAEIDRAFMDLSYIRNNFENVKGVDSVGEKNVRDFGDEPNYGFRTEAPVEDLPVQSVPEPTAVVGLLAFSAVGLSSLKKKGRLQ